ncbi:MAG: aspartate aminotransferase family protein [Armatimonadetes bacterium]|nr:aspartate aminotransferase family protein [Armatimonadota bacterium]
MSPDRRASEAEGDVNASPLRLEWQRENISPAAAELLQRDAGAFLHQDLSTPCLNALACADGSWIEDTQGRRYLDFHGNMVHQVGYAHPHVVEAVKSQIDELCFAPRRYTNSRAIELAERLAAASPARLSKVLFAPGGSAAIGIALKLARIVTGRHKTVSMWDSFHGASMDACSVGGESGFRWGIGPLLPGSEHVPPPDPLRCPLGCGGSCSMACANYLEYVLDREGDVGAVIAEPIRCTTVAVPPPGYWERVKAACQRHGALLIFDEIPTCLGRTGEMFATAHTGVVPDILVLGKGLGGGVLPLAAVVADARLDVAKPRSIGHYTHEKNPVLCAAGLATLDVIEQEGLAERSKWLGKQTLSEFEQLLKDVRCVREVRGVGLLFGIELDDRAAAERILYRCLSAGLNFKVSMGTVLTLAPPLNIAQDDLSHAVQIVCDAIRQG